MIAAVQFVVAAGTVDSVLPVAAVDRVVAAQRIDVVVARSTEQAIVTTCSSCLTAAGYRNKRKVETDQIVGELRRIPYQRLDVAFDFQARATTLIHLVVSVTYRDTKELLRPAFVQADDRIVTAALDAQGIVVAERHHVSCGEANAGTGGIGQVQHLDAADAVVEQLPDIEHAGRIRQPESIESRSALDGVIAAPIKKYVVAGAAENLVVAAKAVDSVVTTFTEDRFRFGDPGQFVARLCAGGMQQATEVIAISDLDNAVTIATHCA